MVPRNRRLVMTKESLISKTQTLALKELGFNELTLYLRYGVPVPTVDEAIDWLRRRHNIIIYNKIEPFVDPADQTHKTILFRFGVKRCDINHLGWNGRLYIGETRFSKNIYSLKREAISIAIKYIMSHEKKKSAKSATTKK